MKLCINCDDFNLHPDVDQGILEAVDAGVVTAVSAFFNPADDSALRDLRRYPQLDVGLHADLTSGLSGEPVSPFGLAWRAATGRLSEEHTLARFRHQFRAVRDSLGRELSHLDAHEHVHILPSVRHALQRLQGEYDSPYLRVPRDVLPGVSWKAWLLRLGFAADSSGIVFVGVSQMGRIDEARIDVMLQQLRRRGYQRVLWMVHAGRRLPHQVGGRGDYPHREDELNALLQAADRIRETAELVPLRRLL